MELDADLPQPVERLRAISEHVRYEIDMWCRTRDMLAAHLWEDIDGEYLVDTATNALLESFTVHTRALMAFLYDDATRDDVSARHFFTDDEWEAMTVAPEPAFAGKPRNPRSNAQSPVLTDARRRVGKEIAHLTYKRLEVEGDGKLWHTHKIVAALAADLFRFIDQVPQDRVCHGFKAVALCVGGPPQEPGHVRLNEPGVPTNAAHATQGFRPG